LKGSGGGGGGGVNLRVIFIHCDMTPASPNSELIMDVYCYATTKYIFMATNKEATMEELPLLCNGAVNTPSQKREAAFSIWSVQSCYNEEFS
jgi:hypothetical protein